MKALSIRQPWAFAILHMGKDIEDRDWRTSLRGTFAIHAAKGMTRDEWESFTRFALDVQRKIGGSIILPGLKSDMPRGAIVGLADLVDCVTSHTSPWFQGGYGFVLSNVCALPEPIPCTGALMFWDVPAEIAAQIEAMTVKL